MTEQDEIPTGCRWCGTFDPAEHHFRCPGALLLVQEPETGNRQAVHMGEVIGTLTMRMMEVGGPETSYEWVAQMQRIARERAELRGADVVDEIMRAMRGDGT